jgi:hypothetical protein
MYVIREKEAPRVVFYYEEGGMQWWVTLGGIGIVAAGLIHVVYRKKRRSQGDLFHWQKREGER